MVLKLIDVVQHNVIIYDWRLTDMSFNSDPLKYYC